MKRHAFTLIEILVVIALIAILAGIAVPSFTRLLERGRTTQDANNLRQLGLGTFALMADNNDSIFISTTPDVPWPQQLNPKYIQIWKVFRSPFDNATGARPDTETPPAPVSYGVNNYILKKPSGTIYSVSSCILMAPITASSNPLTFGGVSSADVVVDQTQNPIVGGNVNSGGTHMNSTRINVLYADAHVAAITMPVFHNTSTDDATSKKNRWNTP
ncbi:MAG: type II secretion system GspH family protein [Verrucomicrobiota bacterium]|nr:type II secretion system GspH family protein [Verrucomicrobiota bacterium]